ncbi:hypothetical protein L1887_05530 [Cichorium endivia]|nr:hypothetical protein L1887_05530 [Cichorium endivia]
MMQGPKGKHAPSGINGPITSTISSSHNTHNARLSPTPSFLSKHKFLLPISQFQFLHMLYPIFCCLI